LPRLLLSKGPSGFPAGEIHVIAVLPEAELAPAVTRMLRRGRQRALQDRRSELRDVALVGIRRLVSEAIWSGGDRVHLDPGLLLGPALSDPTCKYVVFSVDDHLIAVERCRLIAVRRLARALPGLTATVDRAWLHFRWRDGRGGLFLRSPNPSWSEREHVLSIVLTPPGAAMYVDESVKTIGPAMGWAASCLGDALTELDLHT
jgi:hypothetical protein